MSGMLAPVMVEKVSGQAEVRDLFKASKVGTIAGCYVTDGSIPSNSEVRLIRDGVVVFTGKMSSLKRFKDDAKEVQRGFECGITIDGFNDVKVGDIIEAFKQVEED
jgi:translation initiation factor IF-2